MPNAIYGTTTRTAVRSRLEIIGEALELQPKEIERAAASFRKTIEFAKRYNVSLDYILTGDVRTLLRAHARACSTEFSFDLAEARRRRERMDAMTAEQDRQHSAEHGHTPRRHLGPLGAGLGRLLPFWNVTRPPTEAASREKKTYS
jgi:hypothetical protein